MNLRPNRVDLVGTAIATLTLLGSLTLWSQLPSQVAIHFSASGDPNTVVPKAIAVALIPAVMLGSLAILRVAAHYDPPDDERVFVVTAIGTMLLLLAAVQFLVLGWNLGYAISMDAVLVGAVLWVVALVGYSYHRTGTLVRTKKPAVTEALAQFWRRW
ncbi:DUF1648 domain-containing protein [Halococcus hamelinensis]|uniref:DUF1648 domain-containing protein n=1 Tax=Halococcus hamelinensis 100A6 TaxID=1132509 RepID=M0MCA6_9EURY|nr:DUF1648 domain-containing protein [Halococcus hamelinensis]EMA41995.1 hypothetical protein C447_00355 [Halococcus hamelinensis 100A6]